MLGIASLASEILLASPIFTAMAPGLILWVLNEQRALFPTSDLGCPFLSDSQSPVLLLPRPPGGVRPPHPQCVRFGVTTCLV